MPSTSVPRGDGEVCLSGEGSAGGEELRLRAVGMRSPAAAWGNTTHCLFSAVKTCIEALENICWCYWKGGSQARE